MNHNIDTRHAPLAVPGKAQSQMVLEIAELAKLVSSVQDTVNQLHERLSPVLRAEPSPAPVSTATEVPSLVPHALSIHAAILQLVNTHEVLLELQRRLEV